MSIAKGRMAVYSKDHKFIDQYLYYTSSGMSKKMDEWMKEYAGLEGSYITVRPYIDGDKEFRKQNTTRLHIPYVRPVVKLENGQEFMRPPTVYNNIPTYKYDD